MTEAVDRTGTGAGPQCAFCGYPIPGNGVSSGPTAVDRYCSTVCRDAAAEGEEPFAGQHDFVHVRPGVAVLDRVLPGGFRADSLVLFRGEVGSSRLELQLELAWRAIQRGEPVIVLSYVDTPNALVERFLAHDWNVLPALERDLLHVVDCFTRRLSDPENFATSRNRWNRHLSRALDEATTTVRNPDDLREVEGRLRSVAEDLEMTNRGMVVVDSLEEIGTLVSDPQVENFLKELRATVCQNRFVPVVTGRCADRTMLPDHRQVRVAGGKLGTDLTYFVDGLVDLRLNSQVVENVRLKQLSVRQMSGVRFVPEWVTFECGPNGHVPFEPRSQTQAMYAPGPPETDSGQGGVSGRGGPATASGPPGVPGPRGPPPAQERPAQGGPAQPSHAGGGPGSAVDPGSGVGPWSGVGPGSRVGPGSGVSPGSGGGSGSSGGSWSGGGSGPGRDWRSAQERQRRRKHLRR